jgi:hypothetical protein
MISCEGLMGAVASLPCCVERSKEVRQLQPSKIVSTKISNILNKLGTLDEFTEAARQLNSPLPLSQPNPTFKHPWAKPPTSVAAQGAFIMASRIRNAKEKDIALQYWKAGCLTPLLNILMSGRDDDKVHAAFVALQALTDNCTEQELLDEIVQMDGLTILCKWLKASTPAEGVRMTSATVARNVIGKNKQYKAEFVRLGGLKPLVSLLVFDKKRIADDQYTQWILERINDIRDYLEGDKGGIDKSIAKTLETEGIRQRLQELRATNDNDIIEDAMDVLAMIENI